MSLIPAGSSFGPIRTKSLYITGKRFTPSPSARNFCSADLACTNTTSASPRRAVSSAWPVPCAKTFTVIPVFCLKIGSRYSNRPESCVDVVDATTMDLSCAYAVGVTTTALSAMAAIKVRRLNMYPTEINFDGDFVRSLPSWSMLQINTAAETDGWAGQERRLLGAHSLRL